VVAINIAKDAGIITGGLHLKMPDSIADEKALKRPIEKNERVVEQGTIEKYL